MADTVVFQATTLATPPDATVIATDDAGAAGQVQIVKLAQSANGSATPIDADSNGLKVQATSLPLPSGAATSAKQDTEIAALSTLITQTDGVETLLASLDGKTVVVNTGAVVVSSSALPSGAATLAEQQTQSASLGVIDDWDESDRAKVNPIVGQAGVAGGAGSVGATTQRTTLASDDPAVTSLQILDDWDESDRAKVNPIVGVAGVAAGAGAVNTGTQRTTLASDDPAVTALQIMDDWDESDRAKVNLISGQAAITGGAGAVAANTPRVTHASDDPVTTSVQLIDDAVITDDVTTFTAGSNKGLAIAAAVDDDSTDQADEGDMVIPRATRERKLRVVSALDSAAMQSGNDEVTPKFKVISASSSGDNTLVSGVSNKKIRVLSYVLMANGTVNAKFQSSTGGDITGLLYLVANTGASSGFSPVGHFETVAGEALELNLSGAVAVGGHLTYIEVD